MTSVSNDSVSDMIRAPRADSNASRRPMLAASRHGRRPRRWHGGDDGWRPIIGGKRRRCDGRSGVSLANLNRLIDYPADDMTITVEAGMTIAELNKRLAEKRQWLPVDVARPDRDDRRRGDCRKRRRPATISPTARCATICSASRPSMARA